MFTQRRRRGFTLIEIVIASTLSAVLGLAIAAVLVSSARVSKVTVMKATTEQQVRDLNQNVVRFVRSAVSPRRCLSPAANTPASSCLVVVADSSPFVGQPTSNQIVFYAYTDAAANPLSAPDRVTIKTVGPAADNAVTLEVWVERAAVSYTESWRSRGAPEINRRLVLSKPSSTTPPLTSLFTFLDTKGAVTTAPSEIAVVVFSPQVRVTVEANERIFGSPVFIALPTKGFGG